MPLFYSGIALVTGYITLGVGQGRGRGALQIGIANIRCSRYNILWLSSSVTLLLQEIGTHLKEKFKNCRDEFMFNEHAQIAEVCAATLHCSPVYLTCISL